MKVGDLNLSVGLHSKDVTGDIVRLEEAAGVSTQRITIKPSSGHLVYILTDHKYWPKVLSLNGKNVKAVFYETNDGVKVLSMIREVLCVQ